MAILTHNEILEIGKIMSDYFKHMTTLNTGMVVLMITIVEKVFTPEKILKNRVNSSLLLISLLSFIFSLLVSLRVLLVIPSNMAKILQGDMVGTLVDNVSFYISIYSFFLGVLLFIVLAGINFYSNSKLGARKTQRHNIKKRNET